MTDLLQHCINGISLGSIYALIALGYTLVFGVLKLINFAHGEMVMLGAFISYYFTRWMGWGTEGTWLTLLVTLVVVMLSCGLIGMGIERIAYRPLRQAPRLNAMITAMGVSLFFQYSAQLFFGAEPKLFPQIGPTFTAIETNGVRFSSLQFIVLAMSLILMLVLHTLVFRSSFGRAMRAVSFHRDTAELLGISSTQIISRTFFIGSALAGAAGVLVGLIYPKIEPLMGVLPGLKAFVAAVLGGIGNITGAVVGALILGFLEEFVVAFGASSLRDALAFALLILILLFKPQGLFGDRTVEKV